MDQKRGAVVEQYELVLAAADDVGDARTANAPRDRRSESASLGAMMHADGVDTSPAHRAAEPPDGELDLGEFRHASAPPTRSSH